MNTTPVISSSEQAIRRPNGQIAPGYTLNPNGRPKGAVGGRMLALQTLESVIAKPANQEALARSVQVAFDADPLKFYRTYILPTLPSESRHEVNSGPTRIEWASLSTTPRVRTTTTLE